MADEIEYRLVVPATDNAGHAIHEQVLRDLADRMTRHFGGVTIYPAVGCFEEAPGQVHCDRNLVVAATEVEGNRRHTDAEDERFVQHLAETVRDTLGQQAVLTQDLPEIHARFSEGVKEYHLAPEKLDLFLPRMTQNDVFASILPGRFGR